MTMIFLQLGNSVSDFINWFSFTNWLFNAVVFFEIIYMRFAKKWKDKPRPFKVWLSKFMCYCCDVLMMNLGFRIRLA